MRTQSGVSKRRGKGVAILGALACSLALPASAQSQPTVQELLQRLEALERRVGDAPAAVAAEGESAPSTLGDLDQRLRILERRLELQQEETAAKAKDAPVIAVNDKGASLKSGNGDYEFKLRGLVQGDKVSGYDLCNGYEVGHLPWWYGLKRWLGLRPYLMLPLTLLVVLLSAVVLRMALRRRAELRLKGKL